MTDSEDEARWHEAQYDATQPDFVAPDVAREIAALHREEGFKILAPDIQDATGRAHTIQVGRIGKGRKITPALVTLDWLYLDWLAEPEPGEWDIRKARPVERFMLATGSEGGKARAEYIEAMRVSRPADKKRSFWRPWQ